MIVAVGQETYPGERRVALVPAGIAALVKAGFEVLVQSGAGTAAGLPDEQYAEKGAKMVTGRNEVFAAEVVLQVRAAGANPDAASADHGRLRRDQVIMGRVPRQTLRADIDYSRSESLTTYGRIGVKCWVYKGEVLPGEEPLGATDSDFAK